MKILSILSALGILVSILLYIKSGWNSKLGRMDYSIANKSMLYISVICFVIFYFAVPNSHSKTYKNSYHDFRAEFSVDDDEKNCVVNLYSDKAYPAATVFTEEVIRESRIFLKEWPNVESVTFHTKCGEKKLKLTEVQYLNQSAKDDQLAELGFNLGLYDIIDGCTF
jgi:hypothetical protein